jgi:hypothetical protein
MKQNNPKKLEQVKCQFEKWRLNRSSRKERIPDYLWEQAVELCSNFSIRTVSKVLSLDFNDLKHRLGQTQLPSPISLKTKDFVEVSLPVLSPFQIAGSRSELRCSRVEVERKDGVTLRMYPIASQSLDALALFKAFLGGDYASDQR